MNIIPLASNDVGIVRRARGKYVAVQERIARDVLVLLDASGSMGGTKISESKQSIQALGRNLSTDDRLGLYSFSAAYFYLGHASNPTLRENLPLGTVDNRAVDNALFSIVPRGGTPFYDSLSACLDKLNASFTGGRKPVLVTLTDGMENASRMTTYESLRQKLSKSNNVSVYLIGVGLDATYKHDLEILCSPSHCHYHDIANFTGNISEAFEAFQDWMRHPEVNAYRPINLVPWHSERRFTFTVEVNNCSSRDLPPDATLVMSGLHPSSRVAGKSYHVGSLRPGEKKPVTVSVSLSSPLPSGVTSEFLACRHPPELSLNLECNGARMVGVEITPHLQDFCRDLKMSRPSPSCGASVFNILLVGSPGAGKSSFINSAFSLVSESSNVLHNVANVGGVTDHVTTSLRRHVLVAEARPKRSSLASRAASFVASTLGGGGGTGTGAAGTGAAGTEAGGGTATLEEEEEVHIALWDTWGVTEQNYAAGEFEAILEGLLPSGWSMEEDDVARDLMSDRDGVLAGARATAASRKPHAILFFVGQAEVGDEDSMRLLSRNFAKAKRAGYTPMLVIGRADDVDVSVRTDPLLREPSSEGARRTLQGMMKTLADRLQVPEGTVYYSVPYTDEKERRFEIDALMRWNMDAALFAAKQYLNGGGGGEVFRPLAHLGLGSSR